MTSGQHLHVYRITELAYQRFMWILASWRMSYKRALLSFLCFFFPPSQLWGGNKLFYSFHMLAYLENHTHFINKKRACKKLAVCKGGIVSKLIYTCTAFTENGSHWIFMRNIYIYYTFINFLIMWRDLYIGFIYTWLRFLACLYKCTGRAIALPLVSALTVALALVKW